MRCDHPKGFTYCKIHDVVQCQTCGAEYSKPMFRYEMIIPGEGIFEFVLPTGNAATESLGHRAPLHVSHA